MTGSAGKKNGPHEVRPKFREEKPEGLAVRSGGTGLAPHDQISAANVNKWLTTNLFLPRWHFFLAGEIAARRPYRWYRGDVMTPQRRLSDKILLAFEQACEKGELDVAELLVRALELTLTRIGGQGNTDRRSDLGPVLDAYSRLQELKEAASNSLPENRNNR